MGEEIRYYRRFHGYDYSRGASLFVTMATEPRRALFGRVENAVVVLSDIGRLVLESMEAIPRFNPGIRLFEHVLMPDHLHMNLRIEAGLDEPLQVLGAAMRKFKTYTTTLARKALGLPKLWQQGYHDRICVSRRFIDAITRYICYNPLKYELMYNQPEYMHIREPLDSARLDADSFWKGSVGEAMAAFAPYSKPPQRCVGTAPLLLADGTICASASDGAIHFWKATDGRHLREIRTGAPYFAAPALLGNRLVAADAAGFVRLFDMNKERK